MNLVRPLHNDVLEQIILYRVLWWNALIELEYLDVEGKCVSIFKVFFIIYLPEIQGFKTDFGKIDI
jgi:hypothetical protein